MYTLKGELKVINDTQQISDSFKKREFVISDKKGQYEQTILFQTVQDRVDLLNDFKVGDSVEVTFFLNGREWESPKDGNVRYFNSLDAWKIESVSGEQMTHKEVVDNAHALTDADDDLPF
jgi:hypothetical protein